MIVRGRMLAVAGGLAFATLVPAQIPDVLVKIDALLHYRAVGRKNGALHAYDSLGNYGTVGLTFTLEPGFQVFVAQRLEEIEGRAEDDQLDQIYIEDKGYWRVGKQRLPFGKGVLINENVSATRVDTYLGSDAVPAALAYCDGGKGLPKGAIGRIGSRLGLSFALGDHFGIDTASLTTFRFPEDAPGKGRGYRQIVGLDYGRNIGNVRLRAEYASLRRGNTAEDRDRRVSDFSIWLEPDPKRALGLGWSRDWDSGTNELRLQMRFMVGMGVWLEPILQMREEKVRAAGVSMRVKF